MLLHSEESESKFLNAGKGAILALDPGTKRIGIAVSDENRNIAFPYDVIPAKIIFEKIPQIIKEKSISKIIVGVPLTLRGEIGPEAQRVKKFVDKLIKIIPDIEIEMVDERLSSSEAAYYLTSSKNKNKLDSIAASIILEKYLTMVSGMKLKK